MVTHETWSACPQEEFDFRQNGFSRSHASYLRDPGGIILEIMHPPNDERTLRIAQAVMGNPQLMNRGWQGRLDATGMTGR